MNRGCMNKVEKRFSEEGLDGGEEEKAKWEKQGSACCDAVKKISEGGGRDEDILLNTWHIRETVEKKENERRTEGRRGGL